MAEEAVVSNIVDASFTSLAQGERQTGRDGRAPKIAILCRTREQCEEAMKVEWLEEIILDFLEVHGLVQAVEAVRRSGKRVIVATPR